jgi:hypothetical protein
VPVRVLKTVVRPGRRNGGTTLVFTLTRRAVVRFTIVRVHPSCKRIGSFTVRAGRGLNRVRFNGRYRGRPLAAGTYRLLVHARGQARAAAVVTIVVARGRVTSARLRRARNANSCSSAETREIESSVAGWATASGPSAGTGESTGAEGSTRPSTAIRVAGAVKGVVKGVTKKASFDRKPISDGLMVIFGLLTLASACLGVFILVRAARDADWSRLLH